MAVTLRTTFADFGNGISPKVTLNSPASLGDRIYVQINALSSCFPMVTLPDVSGWTELDTRTDGSLTRAIYERILVTGDIGAQKTFTLTAAGKYTILTAVAAGVDPSFTAVATTNIEGTISTTTHSAPSQSVLAGSMSLAFIAERASGGGAQTGYTVPSGFSTPNLREVFSASPGTLGAGVTTKANATAGTSGGGSWVGAVDNADVITTIISPGPVPDSGGGTPTDITFRTSSANSNAGTGLNAPISIPSAVVVGDLMVVSLTLLDSATPTAPTPATGSAWSTAISQTDGSQKVVVYTKKAVAGEPNSSLTWAISPSAKFSIGVAAYTGADYSAITGGTEAGAASITHVTPTRTAVPTGVWTLEVVSDRPSGGGINTTWAVTGATKRYDSFNTLSSSPSLAFADSNADVTGTQGGHTWTEAVANADIPMATITLVPTVVLSNTAPTANAGSDQEVSPFGVYTLDGTSSTDPESNPLTYVWRVISKSPAAAPTVTLSSTTVAKPTFTSRGCTVPSIYTLGLIVTDNGNGTGTNLSSSEDTVVVTVQPASVHTVVSGVLQATEIITAQLFGTPTTPLNLVSSNKTTASIPLSWDASQAPVEDPVLGYHVYKGGVLTGSVTGLSYTAVGLTPNTSYTFTVKSYNLEGESAASTALVISTLPLPGGTTTYSFGPSGLSGAGFQNTIDVSPFLDSGNRPYIMGADVAGIHTSVDRGKNWTPALKSGGNMDHVASVKFSPTISGKAFALATEGLFVSTDFGRSWTKKAGNVDADGNGAYQTEKGEHPRPTGNLLAVDESTATKYLWVACATQGVKVSTDSGTSFGAVALPGDHLRGIVSDMNNPDVLYVLVHNMAAGTGAGTVGNNGVWRSVNARGALTFSKMTGYPGTLNRPEEICAVNDAGLTRLYVAGHQDGIFTYNSTDGWTAINNSLDVGASGAVWQSIYAYKTGSNIVVYAGNSARVSSRSVVKSVNGGASWTAISTGTGIVKHSNLYGRTDTWWASTIQYHTFAGPSYVSSQLVQDPDHRDIILSAGRGGCWVGVQNNVLTPTAVDWYPGMAGLMVTVNNSCDTDPNSPNKISVGNMDYNEIYSLDRGFSFTPGGASSGGAPGTGDLTIFDIHEPSGPSTCYLGYSNRGTSSGGGGIASNANLGTAAWVNENLPVDQATNNGCISVGVARTSGGNRVILTCAQSGPTTLWRRVGTNAWSQITSGPFDGGGAYGCFAAIRGSQVIYAYDSTGVWRSDTTGTQGSWIKIYNCTGARYGEVDSLFLDNQDPTYLWVSTGGNLVRIKNAPTTLSNAQTISDQWLGSGNIGCIGMDGQGNLFAHDRGNGDRLMRSTNPRAGTPTFADVADTFFSNNAGNIRSMHVSIDGYIYTADNGSGVMVGTPSS